MKGMILHMKILMVGPHKDKVKGGMSTVIRGYYNSALFNKCEFISISTVIDGYKLIKVVCFIISYMKMLFHLLFNNIDIVHIHVASRKSLFRKSFYIKLAKFFKRKMVLHIHGGDFDSFYWEKCSNRQRRWVTEILNSVDVIIALGEIWESRISRYCSSEVRVVNNSVEVEEVNLYNPTSRNVLFLGRLEKEKGVVDLIEAAEIVIKEQEDIKFILAGNGNLGEVEKTILDKGIENNFMLLGWVDSSRVRELLKNSMIFVLPSYDEGMPMSILEAMSFGVPIVSTKVGGIPEMIKDGFNGFLVKPGEVQDLANYISYLSKNYNERIIISNKNFNDTNEKFSNEVNYRILLEIYEELVYSSTDKLHCKNKILDN